jgi:phosphoglycolate phosphatase
MQPVRDASPAQSPRRGAGRPRALIFDFDGTLAELNIDFKTLGAEVEALARSMGFTGAWPAGYLLEQTAEAAVRLGDGFRARAGELIQRRELAAADRGALFPFTRGLLRSVQRLGLGAAVISRNCGAAIRRVFPQIDDQVRVFLPREAVSRPKPHPDHALAACAALGVAPGQAALVGDHPLDIQTARAAGCLPVGVASGRVSAGELARAGAVLTLPDAARLLESLYPSG